MVGADWNAGMVSVSGNSLTLNGGGRIYFASSPSDGFSPDMYWQTPLLGKRFSFDVGKIIEFVRQKDRDLFNYFSQR